jgi:hypothetical protein
MTKEKKLRFVYVVIGEYGMDCFSNLRKLSRAYPLFTYRQVYYALTKNKDITLGKYRVSKQTLK